MNPTCQSTLAFDPGGVVSYRNVEARRGVVASCWSMRQCHGHGARPCASAAPSVAEMHPHGRTNPLSPSPESTRSEDIAKAITCAKRKRMREFSRRQIERLGSLETQLSATLEQITDELAKDRHAATHSQQQFDERSAQLQRQSEEVHEIETSTSEGAAGRTCPNSRRDCRVSVSGCRPASAHDCGIGTATCRPIARNQRTQE